MLYQEPWIPPCARLPLAHMHKRMLGGIQVLGASPNLHSGSLPEERALTCDPATLHKGCHGLHQSILGMSLSLLWLNATACLQLRAVTTAKCFEFHHVLLPERQQAEGAKGTVRYSCVCTCPKCLTGSALVLHATGCAPITMFHTFDTLSANSPLWLLFDNNMKQYGIGQSWERCEAKRDERGN